MEDSRITNQDSPKVDPKKVLSNVQSNLDVIQAGWRTINLDTAIRQYKDVIEQQVITKSGAINQSSIDRLRGFVLEGHAKATYNINARAKGLSPDRTRAIIGGDVRADGTIHSPHDQTHDILIESKLNLRQQLGKQMPKVKGYQSKAYKTPGQTQRQLDNYPESNPLGPSDHVQTNTMSEKVAGRRVPSDPISDDKLRNLTEDAVGRKVEYNRDLANKKRHELRTLNFKTAVTRGAVVGALATATTEIVDIVRSGKELSPEQMQESIKRILLGTVDGGARSGVLYVSSELFKTSGVSSVPVLAGANVIYDFSKDLYRLAMGQIDSDDLLCNTVNNAYTSAAAFGGAQVGTIIGTAAAQTTIGHAIGLGATIGSAGGPLGAVIGGVVVGLVVGVGSGLIVSGTQKDAFSRVQAELSQVYRATDMDPSMVQLRIVDRMGQLAGREAFSWKSLVPMYNVIGDLEEYRQRKKVIGQVRAQVKEGYGQVDRGFAQARENMIAAHQHRCEQLEVQFAEARKRLADEAFAQFKVSMAEEYQQYQRAYSFCVGQLQASYEQLQQRQMAHLASLDAQEQKRAARAHLIGLIRDLEGEAIPSIVRKLVRDLSEEITSDPLLKNLNYVNRRDIYDRLVQGGTV